jgi:hypothetical protein
VKEVELSGSFVVFSNAHRAWTTMTGEPPSCVSAATEEAKAHRRSLEDRVVLQTSNGAERLTRA